MDNNQNHITGQAPPYIRGHAVSSSGASIKERIEEWYLDPLERMKGHEAFICLATSLLLYEKYLRRTEQIEEGENFSQGHKVFKAIGRDFGLKSDLAFHVWNNWRNGLLHRAMPNANDTYKWALSGKGENLVSVEGETITLNPWLIRDRIVNKVRQKKEIWRDDRAPLMDVFVTLD